MKIVEGELFVSQKNKTIILVFSVDIDERLDS